jgi:hypothetical protein
MLSRVRTLVDRRAATGYPWERELAGSGQRIGSHIYRVYGRRSVFHESIQCLESLHFVESTIPTAWVDVGVLFIGNNRWATSWQDYIVQCKRLVVVYTYPIVERILCEHVHIVHLYRSDKCMLRYFIRATLLHRGRGRVCDYVECVDASRLLL